MDAVERRYVGGGEPRVLDIVELPLLEAKPATYQRENWLLDPSRRWSRVGQYAWGDLSRIADPAEPLWANDHQTSNGLNDEIPLHVAHELDSSLRLLHVEAPTLSVFTTESFGKTRRRVQGRFRHSGTEYRLWVTDPLYEKLYKRKEDGEYQIGEAFLTVSLSEPFAKTNACYKLIAAVIERNGGSSA